MYISPTHSYTAPKSVKKNASEVLLGIAPQRTGISNWQTQKMDENGGTHQWHVIASNKSTVTGAKTKQLQLRHCTVSAAVAKSPKMGQPEV